jgi:hypothetical protein
MKLSISAEVKEIIKQGSCDGFLYFLPNQQLDRTTYVEVNKVLEALEGKWNRSKKAHVFTRPAQDCIDQALIDETITDRKTILQFFETPPALAERVVELAEIQDQMTVLEPSAGRGRLLEAIHGSPDIGVIAIEIDP